MLESLPKTRALAIGVASRALRRDLVVLAGRGLCAGAACGLAGVIVMKLVDFPNASPAGWAAALPLPCVAGAGAGAIAAWRRRWSVARAGREADRALGLRDRLGSALAFGELASASPEAALAISVAEAAAGSVRPADVVAYRGMFSGRAWPGAAALVLAGAAAGLWLPAWEWKTPAPRPPAPASAQTASQVAVLTAGVRQEAASDPDPAAQRRAEAAAQIERELADGRLSDDQARARAATLSNDAADALQQRASQDIRRTEAIRSALSRAADEGGARSGPLADALRDGDLNAASEEVAKLREMLDQLPAQERAQRAAEWREYADALDRLRAEADSSSERPDPREAQPSTAPGAPGEARSDPLQGGPDREPSSPSDAPPGSAPPPTLPPEAKDSNRSDSRPDAVTRPDDTVKRLSEALRRGAESLDGAPSGQTPPGAQKPEGPAPGQPPPGPKTSPQTPAAPAAPHGADAKNDAPGGESGKTPQEVPSQPRTGPTPDPKPSEPSQPRPQSPGEPQQSPGGQDAPTPGTGKSDRGDAARGEPAPPREAPSEPPRADRPGARPEGSGPEASGRGSEAEPRPAPGESESDGLRDLARELREVAEKSANAREAQRQAERLREQGRELLNSMSAQERSRLRELADRLGKEGARTDPRPGGGDPERPGHAPGLTMLPSREQAVAATQPVDARGEGGTEGQRPIAEWMGGPRQDGEALPAGDSARELRRAAEGAERAVERQSVPPAYGDLVRRVFRRYVERAQPAPPR